MSGYDPVVAASQAFVAANPDYRRNAKVADDMIDFMLENDLPQTDAESWQKAYDQVCRDAVAYDTGKFNADGTREIYFDQEAIDKLPADEMRKRLTDPIFARGTNLLLGDRR